MDNKTKIFKFRTHSRTENRDTAKLTIEVELAEDTRESESIPENDAIIVTNVKNYDVLTTQSTEDYQFHIVTRRNPWDKSELIIEKSQPSEILFISAL